MTGSSEGKAGEEGRKGHRKLQDYSCKGRGTGSGEETQNSLKDQGCGVPQFQEYQRAARYTMVTSSGSGKHLHDQQKGEFTKLLLVDGVPSNW